MRAPPARKTAPERISPDENPQEAAIPPMASGAKAAMPRPMLKQKPAPVVRILVAAVARREIEAFVLDHLGVRRLRLMTLCAIHAYVLAGERKMRSRMIEVLHRLPAGYVMAGLAFRPQLPGVMIFVASGADRMQPFERVVQVVILNQLTVGRRNVFGLVALAAL